MPALIRKFLTALSVTLALVAAQGVANTASAQQDCFLGEVRMFAGNFAPRNWAFTDGQLLAISSNTALFSILGTTYGGDGRTTFGLPGLRGRTVLHEGSGPGLTPRNLGQRSGAETVTLNINQMPSHNHQASTSSTLRATSTAGDNSDPTGRVLAEDGNDNIYLNAAPNVNMHAGAITSATTVTNNGGSQFHNNMPPFNVLNYIICISGTFPSRN